MICKTIIYKPHKLLAPYIEGFAIVHQEVANEQIYFHPSNQPILCFDLNKRHFKESGSKNEFNFSLGLSGVMDRCIFIEEIPNKSVQVIFKPYGAFKLFKTPMYHFVNNGVDLESVLPKLTECIDQLQDAQDSDLAKIKILEQFLLNQLKLSSNECSHFKHIQFACEEIKNTKNPLDVSTICQKIGMSETRFRIHFKEKIGVSPKKFSQIETFQQIQTYIQNKTDVDWMDVVVKFSFFDQTHFINNFKWFFSCTPTEFLKRQIASKSPKALGMS